VLATVREDVVERVAADGLVVVEELTQEREARRQRRVEDAEQDPIPEHGKKSMADLAFACSEFAVRRQAALLPAAVG